MALDISSLASGAASATPYGAALGAASSIATAALADTPTSVTSGSGSYQAGPFVVGSKQVGGKGNSGGTQSASASQTPNTGNGTVEQSASSVLAAEKSQTTLFVIIGAIVVVILSAIFAFRPRSK